MGRTLALRNKAWVNGCMPGLCVAFADSYNDLKSHDRLPITTKPQELCYERRRCIAEPKNLARTTRAAQRTQVLANADFRGYIDKRQSAGKLETQTCMEK